MKKYRLQEGIAWICFECGKKIFSIEDIIMYDHRLYHKICSLTLLEKLKRKVFEVFEGKK
jgi:hypothetical protein